MRQPLTERESELLELAGRLADRFAERARAHDEEETFPHDNYADLAESGYLALTAPPEFGGLGASLHEMLLCQERLAMGDGATALTVNMHVNGIGMWSALWRLTGDPELERLLRGAARGEVIWAGLTSEPGIPNALLDSATIARRVDGGYVLDGYKIFCTNIDVATHWALTCRYEDDPAGPQFLVVVTPRNADGLTPKRSWDVLGMRATQSIDLEIRDLFVPDERVLHRKPIGHFDDVTARTTLSWGVSSFGAVYTGIAAGAMEWAKAQVVKRKRHEDELVRALFGEMELLLETSRAILYRHGAEVAQGLVYEQLSLQEVVARSAIAKVVPVDNAVAIMRRIVEAVGGPTFMRKEPFERMWRDLQAGPVMPLTTLQAVRLLGATTFGIEAAPSAPATVSHRDRSSRR